MVVLGYWRFLKYDRSHRERGYRQLISYNALIPLSLTIYEFGSSTTRSEGTATIRHPIIEGETNLAQNSHRQRQ